MMWSYFHKIASPKYCYQMAGSSIPWFGIISATFLLYGIVGGLFLAPADYLQGDIFRIIYVHVPCALLSLAIYTVIFLMSVIFLIWRIKMADVVASVSAALGATYTLIALLTGAIWGKPTWGTWWIWDARLTSELILLFLYAGYIGLRAAIPGVQRAAKACAILAVVGMIDIPIVHFSVEWWSTLHQGATLSKFERPSMVTEMLYPLLAMIVAFLFFYFTIVSIRLRSEILKREWQTHWIIEPLMRH